MRQKGKWFTSFALAAALGLGLGLGSAGTARADASCRAQCAADFQECVASSENGYPGFHRCRQWYSACLRDCG